MANGENTPILGQADLAIKVGDHTYTISVTVLKDLYQDLILGTDFLNKYGAVIDFSDKRVTFKAQVPIMLAKGITIPPKTEAIVSGHLGKTILCPNGADGECSPFWRVNQKQIVVCKAAVRPRDNCIPIQMFNFSDTP